MAVSRVSGRLLQASRNDALERLSAPAAADVAVTVSLAIGRGVYGEGWYGRVGYGSGSNYSGGTFFDIKEPAREKADPFGGWLNLCWQECPLCSKIDIGWIGEAYCRECHDNIARLIWEYLDEHLDTSRRKIAATRGIINEEFFASGHKSVSLQNAYKAAKSARFEKGETPQPPPWAQ